MTKQKGFGIKILVAGFRRFFFGDKTFVANITQKIWRMPAAGFRRFFWRQNFSCQHNTKKLANASRLSPVLFGDKTFVANITQKSWRMPAGVNCY
ncbi:MAG: hypothetical protein LBQ47_09055 [Endomicrobium sp.]|jgi:hypothetical protein|nr:hypothetical protein [Endomicrobium sp.]